MSIELCHCGNRKDNHRFRHLFERAVTMTRNLDESGNEIYTVIPFSKEETKIRCGVPNCSTSKELHNSFVVETTCGTSKAPPSLLVSHPFQPVEYFFRQIRVSLPGDAACNHRDCPYTLENHKPIITHSFQTRVVVEGRKESDIVTVVSESGNNVKIKWE